MSKSALTALLKEKKLEYLDECGALGGDANAYRQRIQDEYRKNPKTWSDHVALAIDKAAKSEWEREGGPVMAGQGELFEIAGRSVPETLTIPDPQAPRQYRKVLTTHATIQQRGEDAMVKMRNAAKASAAAHADWQQYEVALERASGNAQALLLRHVDPVAQEDEAPMAAD